MNRCIGIVALSVLSTILVCAANICSAEVSNRTVIDRVGQWVVGYWADVASFACTESVTQEKLGSKGKIEYRKMSAYDYLALVKTADDAIAVEELRIPVIQPGDVDQPPLLSTNGFPTLLMIFHPAYHSSHQYRIENILGSEGLWIDFQHVPGTRSTAALRIRDKIYPLALKGRARIDVASGAIKSISAELAAPMEAINIQSFRMEAEYSVQAVGESGAHWLPSKVVVEVHTAMQHWRNAHEYSKFRQFRVDAEEKFQK